MSRDEKIRYIRNSRLTEYAYQRLEDLSDGELNSIIHKIANDLQQEEVTTAKNALTSFYIYLN